MTYPMMLFAAGKGTRMGRLTRDMPKPMITVAGKPLIDHALTLAGTAHVTRKVVNLHYKADQLRAHLDGRDMLFSDETGKLLETGGGLKKALPLLASSPVFTMNTDAVWRGPNPVSHLLDHWRPEMEALLLVVEKANVAGHNGPGDFALGADGRLHRAPEKIYTGLQIIRTDVLSEIADDVFSMNRAWDILMQRGGVFGAVYPGKWCDVGQPESIPLAEDMLDV